jgi:hypothetical protein
VLYFATGRRRAREGEAGSAFLLLARRVVGVDREVVGGGGVVVDTTALFPSYHLCAPEARIPPSSHHSSNIRVASK